MKKLHVVPSPLTNRIYCGHVLEDGLTWGANKQDVTGEACAAVAKQYGGGGHRNASGFKVSFAAAAAFEV